MLAKGVSGKVRKKKKAKLKTSVVWPKQMVPLAKKINS